MHWLKLLALVAALLVADSLRAQCPPWQQTVNGGQSPCFPAGRRSRPVAGLWNAWHAELQALCCSSCGMVQHFDYALPGDRSYYFRPYNALTLEQQREIAAGWGGDYRDPYDNRMFEAIYRSEGEPISRGVGAAIPASGKQPPAGSPAEIKTVSVVLAAGRPADGVVIPATGEGIEPLGARNHELAAVNRPATTARLPKAAAGQTIATVTWQAAPEAKGRNPSVTAKREPPKSSGNSPTNDPAQLIGPSAPLFFSDRQLRRD